MAANATAIISSSRRTVTVDLSDASVSLGEALSAFHDTEISNLPVALRGQLVYVNSKPIGIPEDFDRLLGDRDFISIYTIEIARHGVKGEVGLARFNGLIFSMHTNECNHRRPHFHVKDASIDASIDFVSEEVLAGTLKPKRLGLCRDWARNHKNQLHENWDNVMQGVSPKPIGPFQ